MSQKKETQTLLIADVSRDLLGEIEALGDAQRPAVSRNQAIIFILEEVAEGRNPLEALRPINAHNAAA